MAKIAMTSDKKIMVLNEGVEGIPSITIDSELSDTSTNPVQNKVIKAAIDAVDAKAGNKQDKIGVSGLLKGDGTTISAAVAGTDYVAPDGDGSNATAAFTTAATRKNIATGEKLSVLFGKIAKWFADLGSLAFKSTVAKSDLASDVQTSLGKADSALQNYTETDPTVPAWAKKATKPSYTADEVGARPNTWTPTASEVGAVPTSRTVNGKAMSANITLSASDVGAATMNEVNSAIQTAIGNAIGGSY